ncbi:ZIP family metal transporter [Dactylosporangium sp. McL0621]|uniref:ZIP family metal transporter n=1 Tax=Dactylosporangium sp. McL0621 TaxID=3415678 RepID=UPI003CEA5862
MSSTNIALLGGIAGFTIFLGLPIGRLRAALPRLKAILNAIAIGILVFLLFDILAHAWEPIDKAAADKHAGPALGYGLILAVGVGLGLIGLIHFDRWMAARASSATMTDAATATGWRGPAEQLALLIAIGIGLHNFAEGLAIGNSAAAGEIGLAVLLVIGFGLHNATEGFGIVAPLSAADARPSWAFLTTMGLIGGAPTLLGTLLGQRFTSEPVSIAFLALAAGSILYVVIELLAVARKLGFKSATGWGILTGLTLGFATDAVLIVAGA